MKKIVFLCIFCFLFFSCLTVEKNVRYLKPAEITISPKIKNVAILSFGNTYKNIIYDILFNIFGKEDVQTRFTLIDQNNIDTILKEQNLYNRDEFDDNTVTKLGNLTGADAIIIGFFKNIQESFDNGTVVVERKYFVSYKHDKKGVKIPVYRYVNENIPSIIKTYLFTIDIRMLDITTGTLIHTEEKTYKFQYENFTDNYPNETVQILTHNAPFSSVFPQMEELLIGAGKEFGKYFAKKVAPFAVEEEMSFEIILDDNLNEKFIKFVKNDLFDEALSLMLDNITEIKSLKKEEKQSSHYYNIGCVYEIKGELEKSYEYYSLAVNKDSSNLHLEALKAIKQRINERKKLEKQLNNAKKE